MISQLTIEHFKAIASATIPLGPITVLVGPNDSGKSTILQALMALSRAGDAEGLNAAQILGGPPSVMATDGDTATSIKLTAKGTVRQETKSPPCSYLYTTHLGLRGGEFECERIEQDGQMLLNAQVGRPIVLQGHSPGPKWQPTRTELSRFVDSRTVGAGDSLRPSFCAIANDLYSTLLRLDARAIALPSNLGAPLLPDGSGVVSIVDELLTSGVGDEQIDHINDVICKLSPHVKRIAAKRHASGGKELHFALRSGMVVPASQVSDGVVLAAALAVIAFGARTPRLLIEEPENGLHPRQLKIVADTIRLIAERQGTQIVLTTHSPLLLNHFAAEEVIVVTRSEAGVHIQRMSEARGLDELATELSLGELWYNVGDGNLARPA